MSALSHRTRRSAVGIYVVLVLLALIYVTPFLVQVFTSFKTDADAAQDPLGPPISPTLAAYTRLFAGDLPLWAMNSTIVTIFVTTGRVLFCSMAGYALARIPFRGRTVAFVLLVAIMAVPNVVLLIPKFLVLNQLQIYDSYPALIVPLLADAAAVFIMKGFFESIPASVEEQARVDGAGTFRIFWSVVLPMARPALVTVVILSFQASWNELSHFIIASQDPALNTLTRGIAQLASGQLSQGTQYPLTLAAALLMTLPVALVFFVFQKRLVNATTGAVKE